MWGVLLKQSSIFFRYVGHVLCCFEQYVRKKRPNSFMYLSAGFELGCRMDEYVACMPHDAKVSFHRFAVYCVPWSLRILVGFITGRKSVCNLWRLALVVAFFRAINLTYLEKTSTATRMYCTPPRPLGRGPKKSTATRSPTLEGIIGVMGPLWLLFLLFVL